MLTQHLRLRKSADFAVVVKRGRRVVPPTLVLYALASEQTRFGVVVGKSVGGAVQRNRVKRQLRHRAYSLTGGTPMDVVARALPPAGSAGADVCGDLSSAWAQMEKVMS